MRRGEVWWGALRPRSGSEQTGDRPVIIVSHDGFNRTEAWRSVIVVPLSLSEAQARRGPTAVTVGGPNTGLARESTALCHQVTTIDRSKLIRKLGSLDADQLTRVDEGLTAALAL